MLISINILIVITPDINKITRSINHKLHTKIVTKTGQLTGLNIYTYLKFKTFVKPEKT